MFANLALTNQDHYIPRPLWNAFKDYDGQRLNLREHQDAYEFFTRLQVCYAPPQCISLVLGIMQCCHSYSDPA